MVERFSRKIPGPAFFLESHDPIAWFQLTLSTWLPHRSALLRWQEPEIILLVSHFAGKAPETKEEKQLTRGHTNQLIAMTHAVLFFPYFKNYFI